MATTIELTALRTHVDSGSVRRATILGQKGGWGVVLHVGTTEFVLAASRSRQPRLFATTDSAIKALRAIGIGRFEVDTAHYEPGRLRRARPEVAAANRQLHEDAAQTAWVRSELQKSLDKMERGDAAWVEHDALWDGLEAHARQRVAERDAARASGVRRPAPRPKH